MDRAHPGVSRLREKAECAQPALGEPGAPPAIPSPASPLFWLHMAANNPNIKMLQLIPMTFHIS